MTHSAVVDHSNRLLYRRRSNFWDINTIHFSVADIFFTFFAHITDLDGNRVGLHALA